MQLYINCVCGVLFVCFCFYIVPFLSASYFGNNFALKQYFVPCPYCY